jgi:fatty acid desaturase
MSSSADPQAGLIATGRFRVETAIEWPTIALAIVIYGGWLLTTAFYAVLPLWVSLPLGAWFICWHSSLQHEILHGHPTRWRSVNRFLGMPPLTLWLPYERYRQTHLVHHIDERLTDPLDDPESNYWTREDFGAIGTIGRMIVRMTGTLLGRILISPFWAIGRFMIDEARRFAKNRPGTRAIWIEHLLWCIPVLVWVVWYCEIPVLVYFFGMAVPGTSLMLIRSFAEHRAAEGERERTAIVENSYLLGPLFLFNNLHAMHHEQPTLPWYKIPGWYRANRERLLQTNGGLVYNSYFEVARRYLLRHHDSPTHPFNRIARTTDAVPGLHAEALPKKSSRS